MKDKGKQQKGGQRHAEGEHGPRTKQAIRVELESGSDRDDARESGPRAPRPGGRKIYEDRQQHDEADKNSEKNRLARDADAGRDADAAARPAPRNPSSD